MIKRGVVTGGNIPEIFRCANPHYVDTVDKKWSNPYPTKNNTFFKKWRNYTKKKKTKKSLEDAEAGNMYSKNKRKYVKLSNIIFFYMEITSTVEFKANLASSVLLTVRPW